MRLTRTTWGDIDGADDRLNPMMIPTADPNLSLAMEFELPILRDLDGPQLETDWQLTLGLQSSF